MSIYDQDPTARFQQQTQDLLVEMDSPLAQGSLPEPFETDWMWDDQIKLTWSETQFGNNYREDTRGIDAVEKLRALMPDIEDVPLDAYNTANQYLGIATPKTVAPLETLEKYDKEIRELQAKYPDAGLKTKDQVRQEIADELETIRKGLEDRRLNTLETIAIDAIPSTIGFLGDPVNALTTIAAAPFGAATTVAGTILKTSAAEVVANIASQVKDKPVAKELRERAGRETSWWDIVVESAIENLGVGLISGTAAGLGKALSKGVSVRTENFLKEAPIDPALAAKARQDAKIVAAFEEASTFAPGREAYYVQAKDIAFKQIIKNEPVNVPLPRSIDFRPDRSLTQALYDPTSSVSTASIKNFSAVDKVRTPVGELKFSTAFDSGAGRVEIKAGGDANFKLSVHGNNLVLDDMKVSPRISSKEVNVELLNKLIAEARALGFDSIRIPKDKGVLHRLATKELNNVARKDLNIDSVKLANNKDRKSDAILNLKPFKPDALEVKEGAFKLPSRTIKDAKPKLENPVWRSDSPTNLDPVTRTYPIQQPEYKPMTQAQFMEYRDFISNKLPEMATVVRKQMDLDPKYQDMKVAVLDDVGEVVEVDLRTALKESELMSDMLKYISTCRIA